MPPKQQGGQTQLSLENLSLDDLNNIKKGLDEDLGSLGRAYDSLRQARTRFNDSKMYLENLKGTGEGQSAFVPMSTSLYVTGEMVNRDRVLVDVGTGYFVEQSVARAQTFFQKRINQMTEQLDSLNKVIQQKNGMSNNVIKIMQQKAEAQRMAQQGQ